MARIAIIPTMKLTTRIKQAIKAWHDRRYGYDELSSFLYAISILLVVLAVLLQSSIPLFASLLLILLNILRAYSKNIEKRTRENDIFLAPFSFIKRLFSKKNTIGEPQDKS